MMLSMFVGNGAQLCAMTGVTLGLLCRRCCGIRILMLLSVCALRVSVAVKPRLDRYCYDGLLDVLWRVSDYVYRLKHAFIDAIGVAV